MSRSTLIVAISARALVESAVRAGYECSSVDYFGDSDAIALAPNRALGPGLSQGWSMDRLISAVAGIETASITYGANLENHPETVARLAEDRELLGVDAETLSAVRRPEELATALAAAGIAAPPVYTRETADRAGPERTWLRKRRRSGGGAAIRRWSPGEPLAPGEVLQGFVEGTPGSLVAVADGRRAVVLGLTRQLLGVDAFGASGFRYCGSLYPFCADPDTAWRLQRQASEAADAVVRAFGLRGAFGIDFVSADDGLYVVEVNPRPTASMELLERALGLSIFDLHVHACRGDAPLADAVPGSDAVTYGKAILFARREITVGEVRGWRNLAIRDIPRPGSRIGPGQPICTVFASAGSAADCRAELERRAGGVRRTLRLTADQEEP